MVKERLQGIWELRFTINGRGGCERLLNYIYADKVIHNIIIDESDQWVLKDGIVMEGSSQSKSTGVLSFDGDADEGGEERREEVKEKGLEFLNYS